MTAPAAPPLTGQSELLALLMEVDASRTRARAIEERYLADVAAVYSQRLTQLQAAEEDDDSPLITAAVLASVVVIVRKALNAGAEEGASFATEQFAILGVPSELLDDVDLPLTELGDQLVRDFLVGQVATSKKYDKSNLAQVFAELQLRAKAAVISAVQTGRGLAVEQLFLAAVAVLNANVHKLWVARFDLNTPPCPLCVRLHGTHVPVGEDFPVPDTEPPPYRGKLPGPPRHINCRCSLVLFLPDMLEDGDVTPLSMQSYATWALSATDEDRANYVAMTLVHVKAYTRMVDGKLQHVSGYYYDIQTGQKYAEGSVNVPSAKEVSAPQAKAITQSHKAAKAAPQTSKSGEAKSQYTPGTYRLDRPGEDDDVQVVVHKDGSSTSIYKGVTEDADPAKTSQFLAKYDGLGLVTKISDDTKDPTFSELESPDDVKGTLPPGWYVLPDNKEWGGVEVNDDGTGTLYKNDFAKSFPIKETAVKQIANGNLGKFEEVEPEYFKSDWHKGLAKSEGKPEGEAQTTDADGGSGSSGSGSASSSASQSGSASASSQGSAKAEDSGSAPASSSSGEGSEGAKKADTSSSAALDGEGAGKAAPEPPDGGHGGVVSDGPSLFSVGTHSVQVDEGSQVYKSPKSKDTLYVLKPNGDLIKYNPQGAGVQATLVGSSENKLGRAQLIAGLSNVTDDGQSLLHMQSTPGTGKTLVGGVEMTTPQIDALLNELESSDSSNISASLKKVGSPLAAGNSFHAVAAPFKAYYNNKTKPALIHALKHAQGNAKSTPLANAPAVAHLESSHGLEEIEAQLGHADVESIHQAMHAVDPFVVHNHDAVAPGFISLGGVPVPPQVVASAIEALKSSPSKETGIKKPLKAANSPIAGLPLQDLVNTSPVTDKYKGSNGKVHYGKIKAAVIDLLQNAYDEHTSTHKPVPFQVPSIPENVTSVQDVLATQAQIKEMQEFFDSIDLDIIPEHSWKKRLEKSFSHNPLYGINWRKFAGDSPDTPVVADHELNQKIHAALEKLLKKDSKSKQPTVKPDQAPDAPSPDIVLSDGTSGTTDQLLQYKNLLMQEGDESEGNTVKVPGNPFSGKSPSQMMAALGVDPPADPQGNKAALADAVQKKVDLSILGAAPAPEAPPAGASISVGGKQVTKQDLLTAIEALKGSSATGIKGPLKGVDSPLSSVDVKSYVEADSLSAKYKGSNGKVHYGKLKAATIDVLQAKADAMSDAPGPDVADQITEVGSPEDFNLPEPLEGVEPDLPSPGLYVGNDDFTLKVFDDGSGEIVSAAAAMSLAPESVKMALAEPTVFQKVSDTPEDLSAPNVKGVQIGTYYLNSMTTVSVLDTGHVFVTGVNGDSVMGVELAKPHVLSTGLAPNWTSPLEVESWMKDAVKDPNGLLVGDYIFNGFPKKVTKDGPEDISAQSLAAALFSGDAQFIPASAVFPEDEPDPTPAPSITDVDAEFEKFVASVKAAPYQDQWATSTTPLSQGFQKAVKTGKLTIKTGNNWYVHEPGDKLPQVDHYQYLPDGTVKKVSGTGQVIKQWDKQTLMDLLKDSYDGPAPDPIQPLPPDTLGEPEVKPDLDDPEDVEVIDDLDDDPDFDMPPPEDDPDPGLLEEINPTVYGPSASVDDPTPVEPASLIMMAGKINFDWIYKKDKKAAVKKWAAESGYEGVVGQHLHTASEQELSQWMTHWTNGDWDKAYEIEASKVTKHKAAKKHPGSPDNPMNAGGFKKPVFAAAVPGEVPPGQKVPGNWPDVEYWQGWDEDQADEYLLAANIQYPTGLHQSNKKILAWNHYKGNIYASNSLSLLGKKNFENGHQASSPIVPAVPTYGPGQAVPLPPDFTPIDLSKTLAADLTNAELDKYISHLGSKKIAEFLMKQPADVKQALVALHAVSAAGPNDKTFKSPADAKKEMESFLAELPTYVAQENSAKTQEFIRDIVGKSPKTFTLDKDQPYLEGSTQIYHVTDNLGNPWLFKVGKSQHRVDIEDANHKLAELSGIQAATSIKGSFQGQSGQFQSKIPSKSTLRDVDAGSLPISALSDLMRHHVQDWVTNNDDSVGRNFLLTPDGQHVVQIDLARGFARFGQPGSVSLNLGKLSNWESVYYERIYENILNGKHSDKDIDSLYRASIRQATKTKDASNEDWAEAIRQGTALRPNFNGTSAKDQADLIDQAIARKTKVVDDFEKFWDGIYESLGRAKPTVKSGLAADVYTGASQEHLDHAKTMGYAGHSTFFAGTDFEDAHLLAQVVKSGPGEQVWLSGQLRKGGDKKLTEWLQKHADEDISVSSAMPTLSAEQRSKAALEAVGLSTVFNDILGAVKTISHHHKQGDKNYNTAKLASMDQAELNLQLWKEKTEQGNFPTSIPEQDQSHFVDMLDYYIGQIESAKELKISGGQSSSGQYSAFDFKLKPEQALPTPAKPVDQGIKVVVKPAEFDGTEVGDDLNLTFSGEKLPGRPNGQRGKMFVVTLGDGTEIEYRSWDAKYSVPLSQQGQLRVRVRNHDGTTAGVSAAFEQLKTMGLDMREATDDDHELFYWRHLYGVLQDRVDRDEGKNKEVSDYVKANLPGGSEGTPALQAKEELERWRAAWSRLTSEEQVKKFVDNQKYLPRFSHPNPLQPEMRGGQPYWLRFDATEDAAMRRRVLTRFTTGGGSSLVGAVKGGGVWASEDRAKYLGRWIGGMSSGETGGKNDQDEGSSNFAFLTQYGKGAYGDHSKINYQNLESYAMVFSPRLWARTSTYAFHRDKFGDISQRKNLSEFTFAGDMARTDGWDSLGDRNEVQIKHGVTLLDDIELIKFPTQQAHDDMLALLKSRGITEIRGVPIETRLVGPNEDFQKAYDAALEAMKTWRLGEDLW